jgi:hypothetical protein
MAGLRDEPGFAGVCTVAGRPMNPVLQGSALHLTPDPAATKFHLNGAA